MIKSTTTLNINESALLEIAKETDDNGREFIVKSLLCAVKFGDEFFNNIQTHIKNNDGKAIREIVEEYHSLLERKEQ